jgi:hypothetical protein
MLFLGQKLHKGIPPKVVPDASSPAAGGLSRLMFLSKKVINGFDGIEGGRGDIHKDRIPMCHSAVPQAGKFERFQVLTVPGLSGDEKRSVVHKVFKLKGVPFPVSRAADEIHRVEVSG